MNIAKTRREFVRDGIAMTGALAAVPASADQDKKPTVILSCETYSLRDLLGKGKLTMEQVPALYRDLDIQGISWNDMFFKSWDEEYLGTLIPAVQQALDSFRPEILFYVGGADPYCEDQLGGLSLTKEGLKKRDRSVFEGARRRGIPVATTLAGGYARRVEDTVRIHVNTILAASEVALVFPSAPAARS